MLKWIVEHWDTIVGVVSVIFSLILFVVWLVKRVKAFKNAGSDEERANILSEIKSSVYGLVAVAEQMFIDIPKSGASKLLYVLNHVKSLCEERNIEYDADAWTEFINGIVGASNDVITAKETEKAISGYIAKVKEEIPYFMDDADKLFEVIPDSAAYKVEYILKLIANACAKHAINVYDLYDWRAYIEDTYASEKGVYAQ